MNTPFPIPTGWHRSAQGCLPSEVLLTKEGEATLGHAPHRFPQPQRGCITDAPADRCNPVGVDDVLPRSPRVASPTRQPWAERLYPVGVTQPAETQRLASPYGRKLATLAALMKSLVHQAFTEELKKRVMRKEEKLKVYRGELDDRAVRRDSRHTAEAGNYSGFPNSSKGRKDQP